MAEQQRTPGVEGRWDLETDAPPESWRRPHGSILDELTAHVPGTTERRPWLAGHGLHIRGQGGLVGKERRHYTILGHGEYTNYIGGCRTLATDSQLIRTADDMTTQIARADDVADMDVPWGRDSLTVHGDAEYSYGARNYMMSGIVQRNWNGGVMRVASMEGAICGGGFLRLIASPSATLSGLMSGDVYGGCARVATVRTYLAVLHYRAAAVATWQAGVHLRSATFVIEPIIGSPSPGSTPTRLAAKLARLGRVLSAARMLCPPLDILIGVVTFIPFGLYGLGSLIASIVKKPNPIPPTGPPRTRVRNMSLGNETFGSILIN